MKSATGWVPLLQSICSSVVENKRLTYSCVVFEWAIFANKKDIFATVLVVRDLEPYKCCVA
jgi:hypothetical protein